MYLSICLKFKKPCLTDIKILLALEQDVRTCAGNLTYGVRLQVNVGDRLAKNVFRCVVALFKKNLKKMRFVQEKHFRKGSPNFNFSIASINSNYGGIFSLPNKLKFDDSNICTNL